MPVVTSFQGRVAAWAADLETDLGEALEEGPEEVPVVGLAAAVGSAGVTAE
ncbi:MAG: hypothetical protein ABFS42_11190 [Candidatus Krumholzibacteriota bacterium]